MSTSGQKEEGKVVVTEIEREWWHGHLIAHIADGKSLVRVGKSLHSKWTLGVEVAVPTAAIPTELREVGTPLLISWRASGASVDWAVRK
jgi:hypothetical protein